MGAFFNVLMVVLLAFGRYPQTETEQPIAVKPLGELEVVIKAERYDNPYAKFPQSEYTEAFIYWLNDEFLDLDDPDWWDRFYGLIEWYYQYEREADLGKNWIHSVPSLEWIKKNVTRGIDTFSIVEAYLPTEGSLLEQVDEETYRYYTQNWPGAAALAFDDGSYLYAAWRIEECTEGEYCGLLSIFQDARDGVLLFEFPDSETYAIIELPEELQQMRAEDLNPQEPSEWTLIADTYQRADSE